MTRSKRLGVYCCDHCGWTTPNLHNMEHHEPACARHIHRVKDRRYEKEVLGFLFDGYFKNEKGKP